MASENPIGPTLIKSLASCNSSIRSKSLKTLLNYIPTQTLIPEEDLKRVWKSLFYCMWHCDKNLNQTHLTNCLTSLLPTLSPQLAVSYFRNFVITMRREWAGIDGLRLDKFYRLVRCFVRSMLEKTRDLRWDLGFVGEFVGVLEKDLFFFDGGDGGLGNGVCYHVVSVFCEEVGPFLPLGSGVLEVLFSPFVAVLGRSENKVLVGKVRVCVFEFLLKCGRGLLEGKKSASGGEIGEKDGNVVFGRVALGMGFAARFFELGASEGCVQGNRKVVYGLHEEFSRLEKEMKAVGVEIVLPEVVDDEVPLLVPIRNGGENGGSENGGGEDCEGEGKKKRKKKKAKKGGEVEEVVKEKKKKKAKEGSEVEEVVKEKKSKKKKKKKSGGSESAGGSSGSDSNGDVEMIALGDGSDAGPGEGEDEMVVSEAVMSNLQKQFEKIAAESGLDGDGASAIESPTGNGKVPKKRKRSKSVVNAGTSGGNDAGEETAVNTEGKSGKRVRFSMKNNVVWKPNSPLPPQSLRIPPSSTPRGSALKKGCSPGPIRDTSQDVMKGKKKKKPSPLKKARKVKTISPAVKRAKKVKPMSA